MFDERWPEEAEELAHALGDILAKECTTEALRTAEAGEAENYGRIDRLDAALDEFGLWDLPADPYLLARTATQLGAHLAPVPFFSATPAIVLLGQRGVANGVDRRSIPATLGHTAVLTTTGVEVIATPKTTRRSSGGELVTVLPDDPAAHHVDAVPTSADPDAFRAWGFLLESARLVGAAQALIRYGVEYVSGRKQFGQLIGAFQAVSHPLADAATAVVAADLLTRHATYLTAQRGTDDGPPLFAAAMAAAKAKKSARQAASTVHQVLGGYGFTIEADCQLYSRRIRNWTATMPDPGPTLAVLARTVIDPRTRASVTDLWQFDKGFSLPQWALRT